MYVRMISLLCTLIFSVVLAGCTMPSSQEVTEKNETNAITIHAVEFYSRTPIDTVDIGLYENGSATELERMAVTLEGTATFQHLESGQQYTAVIYRHINGVSEVQSSHTFTFDPAQEHIFFETFYSNGKAGLSVPVLAQNPELPNGCEITSLAAILQYYGENISKTTLSSQFLHKTPVTTQGSIKIGPDPNIAYAGDPASKTGYYVFPKPIVKAANDYLTSVNSNFNAYDVSGADIATLESYIVKGIPIITWITIDLKQAVFNQSWVIAGTNKIHAIYSNLHAVVLTGISNNTVTIMNPLTGTETIPLDTFLQSFNTLKNRAVVIY